ncbi:hypothetical protein [Nitrososphaera sp.]|uniref:hypothetical protein n=1 Tax=Nitrososphaera sp. TaxID=1971748 RepID=UPI00307E73DC
MRKPVLLVDDAQESRLAAEMFASSGREYVEYHIKKFEESCCGELPTTRAPAVFAPEGVFKGLAGVKEYLQSSSSAAAGKNTRQQQQQQQQKGAEYDSSYW